MKKITFLLLVSITLFNACKKDSTSDNQPVNEPVVLISKVINNIEGDTDFGKTLAEFSYNGKQLTKATLYHYSITPNIETHTFAYDNSNHLTGSVITHTQSNNYDNVKSIVTYNGDNISNIKFYKAGNVLNAEIRIAYQDGRIAEWFNPNEVKVSYTYNSDGNNTKQTHIEYENGSPNGYEYMVNNSSFDSKSNLSSAVPFWVYFRSEIGDQYFSFTSGKNNPVNSDGYSYDYQYNDLDYPSVVTWTDSYLQSYKYEYIQVK